LFQFFSSACAPAYSSWFPCRFLAVFPLICTHTHKTKHTNKHPFHTRPPVSPSFSQVYSPITLVHVRIMLTLPQMPHRQLLIVREDHFLIVRECGVSL
jgi:hypothetical protein